VDQVLLHHGLLVLRGNRVFPDILDTVAPTEPTEPMAPTVRQDFLDIAEPTEPMELTAPTAHLVFQAIQAIPGIQEQLDQQLILVLVLLYQQVLHGAHHLLQVQPLELQIDLFKLMQMVTYLTTISTPLIT